MSLRIRRSFVQARMAVSPGVRVEERAYQNSAVGDLPKSVDAESINMLVASSVDAESVNMLVASAVDAESVDMLVASVNGELQISKEVEDLVRSVHTSIYIFRNKDEKPQAQSMMNNFHITEARASGMKSYSVR
eukprot:gene2347-8651_t